MSISDQDLARLEADPANGSRFGITQRPCRAAAIHRRVGASAHGDGALFQRFLRLDQKTGRSRARSLHHEQRPRRRFCTRRSPKGVVETSELLNLRKISNPLEGHPANRRVPGVEASTGSLGQGLSIGPRNRSPEARQERHTPTCSRVTREAGQARSGAAMTASKYKADNLIAVVDRNHYQQTGHGDNGAAPRAARRQSGGMLTGDLRNRRPRLEAGDRRADRARDSRSQPAAILAHPVKVYSVHQDRRRPRQPSFTGCRSRRRKPKRRSGRSNAHEHQWESSVSDGPAPAPRVRRAGGRRSVSPRTMVWSARTSSNGGTPGCSAKFPERFFNAGIAIEQLW